MSENRLQNNNTNSSNKMVKILLISAATIAIAATYFLTTAEDTKKPLAGTGANSNLTENVLIGGDFVLTDQTGAEFSSEKLKGKLSLIYFGFTYCPDICPTSLHKLTEVINTLDKYRIDVTPVFITIDPERDTAGLLKEYLGHFHPKYIGLTGTNAQVKDVADKFKVYYAKVVSNEGKQYMLDHSSFVYLMDKQGKYLKHFSLASSPQEIVEFIRVNTR